MNLEQAIHNRRSIGKVSSRPVEKPSIEKLLEAAVWAPNHYHTEPWRFFVMTGEGRQVLARAYAEIAKAELADPDSAESRLLLQKQADKAFRAPVVIAVAAVPSDNPKIERMEELAATHAAVQNMLLTAHSLGLGAIWRTGAPAYHPLMRKAFGLDESAVIVGFVYVGHPDVQPKPFARTPYTEKTTWLE